MSQSIWIGKNGMVRLSAACLALAVAGLFAGCERDGHDHEGHSHQEGPSHPEQVVDAVADIAYPLKICVISGEKLGDHGKPYDFKHDGRLVRMCCDSCVPEFEKDPAKYIAKIDAATKPSSK